MTKHEAAPTTTTIHFKRGKSNGLVLVLNEGQYVMAEYSERTGQVMWQRVLIAAQRERVEKRLREQFPIRTPVARTTKVTKRR